MPGVGDKEILTHSVSCPMGVEAGRPDTSLAGESEQCLLLVETSAPFSVWPKQSRQENHSANASAEWETEDQLPTQSH